MSYQRYVAPNLEMIEANFAFSVFEESFDTPAREGDVEQRLDRNLRACVREKVLHLATQRISCDDQSAVSPRHATVVGKESRFSNVPDFWSLLRLLDLVGLPRRTSSLPELRDRSSRLLLSNQPRFARTAPRRKDRSWRFYSRRSRPAREVRGNLDYVVDAHVGHGIAELNGATIKLVSGDPVELDAVVARASQQVQRDLPLRSVDDVVGNVGSTTAVAILRPALFGEEEVSVDQGVEITVHISEVDADNAVVNLTRGSAVLALNASGHDTFLGEACLVNESDTNELGIGMVASDDLTQAAADGMLVPAMEAQELLERPWSDACV